MLNLRFGSLCPADLHLKDFLGNETKYTPLE